MPMKRLAPLILFLVLVMGGGVAIGFLTAPGEWYAGLGALVAAPAEFLAYAPLYEVAGGRPREKSRH